MAHSGCSALHGVNPNLKKRKGGMKLIFYMQINKPFYKLILSILVNMASLAQSTRNNKFAKSLQYLDKEVREKLKVFKKLVLSYLMGAARHA